jgi:HK97 family phage major capsid protein
MSHYAELTDLINRSNDGIERFKTRLDRLETKLARPGAGHTAEADNGPTVIKDADGREHKLYTKGQRIADLSAREDASHDLAAFVTDAVLGRKSVSRGPALVSTGLGGMIIDLVRDLTVISEAGASTLALTGPTNATRLTGDPTAHQHTEGANDITQSDVATEAVLLDPRAIVVRIPVTAEAVEDSANLGAVLQMSLAGTFAGKLNALTLATILGTAAIPKSTVAHATATWQGTMLAIGAAMAAKQPLPTALIGNAADFVARASQLASTAGSWLGKPPALSGMTEYPTPAIAAGLAVLGGFSRGLLLAVRQEMRLEVVRFADPGRYSHELIAHMRADGYVTQPASLFVQKLTP